MPIYLCSQFARSSSGRMSLSPWPMSHHSTSLGFAGGLCVTSSGESSRNRDHYSPAIPSSHLEHLPSARRFCAYIASQDAATIRSSEPDDSHRNLINTKKQRLLTNNYYKLMRRCVYLAKDLPVTLKYLLLITATVLVCWTKRRRRRNRTGNLPARTP